MSGLDVSQISELVSVLSLHTFSLLFSYCFQDEFDSSSAALEHSIREVGSYVCLCVFYTEHQKAESDEVPTDEAAPPGHKLVGFLAHLHKHSKRAKTVTFRLVRSVCQPVVSSGAATSDGVGLGADSVAGDPVSENPVEALQVVTLAHGQLSPVFAPSVVMMKRLPSASSLRDQAPIKQFKLVCFLPLLFRI